MISTPTPLPKILDPQLDPLGSNLISFIIEELFDLRHVPELPSLSFLVVKQGGQLCISWLSHGDKTKLGISCVGYRQALHTARTLKSRALFRLLGPEVAELLSDRVSK